MERADGGLSGLAFLEKVMAPMVDVFSKIDRDIFL